MGIGQNSRFIIGSVLGAIIGTFLALQMNPYFWWVGTIVGFAVGYFMNDPMQAFERLHKFLCDGFNHITRRGAIALRGSIDIMIWHIMEFSSLIILPAIIVLFLHLLGTPVANVMGKEIIPIMCIPLVCMPLLLIALIACSMSMVLSVKILVCKNEKSFQWDLNFVKDGRKRAFENNYINFYFYRLPKTLIEYLIKFCELFQGVCAVVYGDNSLLCGACAAKGATIGYFFGNPSVGALVGLLAGLVILGCIFLLDTSFSR